jgi:hypothetical protein
MTPLNRTLLLLVTIVALLSLAAGCDSSQTSTCANGVLDADEEAVDCGGSCGLCPGTSCVQPVECASRSCVEALCAAATCADEIRNGAEWGVDCGGPCDPCATVSACTNGVLDPDEEDVDCGGACAACVTVDPCANGVLDPGEQDVDCGGLCAPCGADPTCVDGFRNQDETDVDCGGRCGGCALGRACIARIDCISASCVDLVCTEPPASCTNNKRDGAETDEDCGGPECRACAVGQLCVGHTDCLSVTCGFGVCKEPTCDDQVTNQDESDMDCGGSRCGACADGDRCGQDSDCASAICDVDGRCVSCTDGARNGDETDEDCGGATCNACQDGDSCGGPADCLSGDCTGATCISCWDDISNGDETGVDCGGPTCDSCLAGEGCDGPDDCVSGFCGDSVCEAYAATAIAAGNSHVCAIVNQGRVACWGSNTLAQLGDGTQTDRLTPTFVAGLQNVTAIGAGSIHSCAVVAGEVHCWGSNAYQETGTAQGDIVAIPTKVEGLSNVNALALGGSHSCALVGDGTVRCWGSNLHGQIGYQPWLQDPEPVPPQVVIMDGPSSSSPSPLSGVTAIAAGRMRSCAIASGEVHCWGGVRKWKVNPGGICNPWDNCPSPYANHAEAKLISGLSGMTHISVDDAAVCAVRGTDQQTFCWGWLTALDDEPIVNSPMPIPDLTGATNVAGTRGMTCVITDDLGLLCLFPDSAPPPPSTALAGLAAAPVQLSGGFEFFAALLADGSVASWGRNREGQFGNGQMGNFWSWAANPWAP